MKRNDIMNKLNIKTNAIVAIASLSILLTGCSQEMSKTTTIPVKEPIPSSSVVETTEAPTEETTTQTNNYQYSNSSPAQNTTPNATEHHSSSSTTTTTPESTEEFTYFKDAKENITNYLNSEDYELLKEKGKTYVITGIDFIFYDQPINGVYFNDLTEDVKSAVIKDVEIIDNAITSYYPNYKESISSKYQIAAEFLNSKYHDVLDSIREYLGNENYEAIGNIKDQIIGDISNKKDEAFDYIKNKYQDWKNK